MKVQMKVQWQGVVVIACLVIMAAALIFVFLVSNGAFAPVPVGR